MQLRTKTLVGKYVHVLSTDPALELDQEDDAERKAAIDAYRLAIETGDLDRLPLKEGGKPLVWEFTHLSAEASAWLLDGHGSMGNNELSMHAIAIALTGIRGATDEEGNPIKLRRRPDPRRRGFRAVDNELLNNLMTGEDGRLRLAWIAELGGRIARELVPRNG